jgi:hypothetical protein
MHLQPQLENIKDVHRFVGGCKTMGKIPAPDKGSIEGSWESHIAIPTP